MQKSKKTVNICFALSAVALALFVALCVCLKLLDVEAIGAGGTDVGLATINAAVHDFFGVNMLWYDITDVLGLVAIATAAGFAVFGLCLLIRRKSFKRVDLDMWLLGAFYVLVIVLYVGFELVPLNYRPIDMGAGAEPSFPSTHTMIVVCIMGTAVYQFWRRIKNAVWRYIAVIVSLLVAAVTVCGRLVSGVHWVTDIIGGILVSLALCLLYIAVCEYTSLRKGGIMQSISENMDI